MRMNLLHKQKGVFGMKKVCALLLGVLILLSGCGKRSEELNLAYCGSFAVPGMMCPDLKGPSHQCSVIERDTKGRILYAYTTLNSITSAEETAYIICQNIDDDSVSFYEDICYQFHGNDFEDLKAVNDWDKELDYDKMSERTVTITFDLYINTNSALERKTIEETFCRENNIADSQIKELAFMDKNGGLELYLIELGTVQTEKYILLCDEQYRICTLPISGDLSDYEKISSFKQENGWS